MAENTKISWADHTFNPWIGCTKISAGCDHCYAARDNERRKWIEEWGPHGARRRTARSTWDKVISWDNKAKANGTRARVFCASLADVFDNHRTIEQSWRDDLWALIKKTPNLDWLLLTKRPQNIKKYLPNDWCDTKHEEPKWRYYPNVWLGVTIESSDVFEKRWRAMLNIPAAIRWISHEPALDSIAQQIQSCLDQPEGVDELVHGLPDWVVTGGESGPGARPYQADVARDVVDMCQYHGVPVHVKQMGDNPQGFETTFKGFEPSFTGKGKDPDEWPAQLQVQEYPVYER